MARGIDMPTVTKTETLYRKVGRRYVPAYSEGSSWDYDKDVMTAGTFRLTHAYSDGGRRYEYDVTPDTAGWVAAATLALHAMTEAIHERNRMTVATRQPLTKKQQAAVQRANAILEDAGIWAGYGWTSAAAHEVAQAGIDAVLAYAKAPKAQEKK